MIYMYLFVSSPGRSGTKYLMELFNLCTNIISIHGGEKYYRDIIDTGIYRNNSNEKIIINRINLLKIHQNIIDTSQIFIHRLVDYVIKDINIKPIYVINLLRNPLEVAISYENRNSYPSNDMCLWRLPLISKDRIIKINKKMTIFQENLFDWIDTQMKFEKYKNYFDKYYILKFEDLNDIKELNKLFIFFNINYDIDKLKECILNNNLTKNNNKIPTKITNKHLNETKDFIEYLKTLDNYPEDIINKHIIKYIQN